MLFSTQTFLVFHISQSLFDLKNSFVYTLIEFRTFCNTLIYDHIPSDIENWDVYQVQNMKELFNNRKECNPDVSMWDVSSVK